MGQLSDNAVGQTEAVCGLLSKPHGGQSASWCRCIVEMSVSDAPPRTLTCRRVRDACSPASSRAGARLPPAPPGSGEYGVTSHLLLCILDPADELVAGQRRDVFPCRERRVVADPAPCAGRRAAYAPLRLALVGCSWSQANPRHQEKHSVACPHGRMLAAISREVDPAATATSVWSVNGRFGYHSSIDRVNTAARSSSVTGLGQVARSRCCFIAPPTRSGISLSR